MMAFSGDKKIYIKIEAWRNRRIDGEHPYLYLDGIVMKRSRAGEVRNVSLLVARSIRRDFGRSSAPARAPKKTDPDVHATKVREVSHMKANAIIADLRVCRRSKRR